MEESRQRFSGNVGGDIWPSWNRENCSSSGVGYERKACEAQRGGERRGADSRSVQSFDRSSNADTEGGITPERLNHAMIAVTRHTDGEPLFIQVITLDTPSETLRGIHLLRIVTQVQMIAFLNTMSEWLDEHPKVSGSHPHH